MFNSVGTTDFDRRVRRVARWLRDTRPMAFSREVARRHALSQKATADDTERVLQQLHDLGFVKPDPAYDGRMGRPTSHWLVNPLLATPESPIGKVA